MDRQTLRDWVHRFNERVPYGLKDDLARDKPRRLSALQQAELAAIVETDPDRAVDGVVRWRRVLKALVAERFGGAHHECTIGKLLKALGFFHISARPRHPQQDGRAIVAFKETFPPCSRPTSEALRASARSKSGSRTRRASARRTAGPAWARRGTRPRQPSDQRYKSAHLLRAICPARIFQPSRSPELNPIENIWRYMRANWLSNRVFDSYDEIIDAACDAWNRLVDQPCTITSIGIREWAHVGRSQGPLV